MISLYIHMPFCKSKCKYCDFLSFPNTEYIDEYKKALLSEINDFCCVLEESVPIEKLPLEHCLEGSGCKNASIKSVFIGGGTPSIVDSSIIAEIMESIGKFNIDENAEITIEANPGTLTEEKVKEYRKSGINRISMGLQAWQNSMLKTLGRVHTRESFLESYELAQKYFDNINVDLMFSLPDQSYDMWLETIENVTMLKPKHISAYSLIIEEGTPFFNMKLNIPDEETDRRMYHSAIKFLDEKGYKQYEISNFAKEGYESVHNSAYWQRENYKGFGLGASSLIDNVRYKNTENMSEYINGITITEKEVLTKSDQMAEFMFLGLRMTKGVSISEFKRVFNEDMMLKYKSAINKYSNYIIVEGDNLKLTTEGIDISNMIFAEML